MAKPSSADRALATRKLLAAARGARLCYGEPVHVDGRFADPVRFKEPLGGSFYACGGAGEWHR